MTCIVTTSKVCVFYEQLLFYAETIIKAATTTRTVSELNKN